MNYLLIVEGAVAEPNLFSSVFQRYGFNVVRSERMKSFESFECSNLSDSKNNIVIAQAPRNRLGELLRSDSASFDFDKAFKKRFNSVFLVFDVDHTNNKDLSDMIRIHDDETDAGLLLVSSPCIEIMSEPGRTEILETEHLSSYNKERNKYFNDEMKLGNGTIQYIANNFEKLALQFLRQNYREFNEPNVMEHPRLVVDMVNRKNNRTETVVVYRYFTTVLYVLLANIFGLTKQIENVGTVESFLSENDRSAGG